MKSAWTRLTRLLDQVRWWIVFPLTIYVIVHSTGLLNAFAWSEGTFKAAVGTMGILILDGLSRIPTERPALGMAEYRIPNVHDTLNLLFEKHSHDFEKDSTSQVRVLGLSLFHSWPKIRKSLTNPKESELNPSLRDIAIRIIIIDPLSPDQLNLQGEWCADAANSCTQIDKFKERFRGALRRQKISIEYRKTKFPFVVHGFIVDDSSVYWSVASPARIGGEFLLSAARHNYYQAHKYGPTSDAFAETFMLLDGWFEYYWNT